tara:strand:- start:89 stop:469 length:381 start_codon:yes stop_codon:yes gene_type:complete
MNTKRAIKKQRIEQHNKAYSVSSEKVQPTEKVEPEPTHIDDFIDDPSTDAYASWFFNLARMPAMARYKFEKQIAPYKLFCDYEGRRVRVTGASCLGDVWITDNHDRDSGYDNRINVDSCSNWGSLV